MKRKRSTRKSKGRKTLLIFTILFWSISGLTCVAMLNKSIVENKINVSQEVGKQYLAAAIPAVSRGSSILRDSKVSISENESMIIGGKENIEGPEEDVDKDDLSGLADKAVLDSVSSKEPLVLIYHTHATESYQPVSQGNFHSIDEKGTVREVGSTLKAALEAKGISVIHDKAIHDSPSYNKSYSRSLDSAKNIISTNPSVKIIIDLHRDAASYTGNNKHTLTIKDKEVAQFCLVVGEGNDNAAALRSFGNKINQMANSLYPGFSKGVILKEFKYNQYIADNYILLEMGNNQNNIDEAKEAAIIFANVVEEVLKEL